MSAIVAVITAILGLAVQYGPSMIALAKQVVDLWERDTPLTPDEIVAIDAALLQAHTDLQNAQPAP